MAKIYPLIAVEGAPLSERKVYSRMAEQLSDDFFVFHSIPYIRKISTGKSRKLQEGEADFVIVHRQYGILVLEVKGGQQIEFDSRKRQWISTDFYGRRHVLHKDPFLQAQHNIKSIAAKIRQCNLFSSTSHVLPFVHGHGVIFPDTVFGVDRCPPHIIPEIVIDADGLNDLNGALERLYDYWEDRSRLARPITSQTLDTIIRDVIMPEFKLTRAFRTQLQDEEDIIIRLTDRQYEVLNDSLVLNTKALIQGYAGTGKTVIAMLKAHELASQGKNVLLLCYNAQLSQYLRKRLSGIDRLEVNHFHRFARNLMRKIGEVSFPSEPDDAFWNNIVPDLLLDAIDRQPPRYDAIIVDEAQDFKENWWVPIEMLVRKDTNFYVFFDPVQDIYKRHLRFPDISTTLALRENCRTTRNINSVVRSYGKVDIKDSELNLEGESVTFVSYCDEADERQKIFHIVKELKGKYRLKSPDIVLLSPHSRENSIFGMDPDLSGYTIRNYCHDRPKEDVLYYESLYGFKGLEANAVILFGIENNDLLCSDNNLYTATSRAKHILFVLHDADWKGQR
ncbi:MAG: NERD domain-containing protein [Deltaproteobacteria bacterium]|nr:NERD domain-containing protein [Deltaproteobacteria bacterium]